MSKKVLLAIILVMTMSLWQGAKARDSEFAYTYQGTTLYYIIDSAPFGGTMRTLTEVGHDAFHYCELLASVTLNEGTETIGYCAFRECTSLSTINYPSALTEIGDYSFQYDVCSPFPLFFRKASSVQRKSWW